MKVAHVFGASGHAASYTPGTMILPQLEQGTHGAEAVGTMLFDDDNGVLRRGDRRGERPAKVAKEQGILLMLGDRCAIERGLAAGEPGTVPSGVACVGTVEGVRVGCFPDLYAALAGTPPGQAITPSPRRRVAGTWSRPRNGPASVETGWVTRRPAWA